MSTWTKRKLGDVTTKIGSGATPRGGQESYHANGIPLIRSLNIYDLHFSIDDLAFIDEGQAKKLGNVTVEKDDVLLNITGASVCRCTSVPDRLVPARVNQHVSIIRADRKKLDGKFLKYILVSPRYKRALWGLATTGATREALTKDNLENFEIQIPDFLIQKTIASILSAYDDLIENNEKRIKILEEMAERLYREWFVKFKFPGHEKVQLIDSGTEYGKIPEGWELKRLGDVANIISGYAFKSSDFQKTGIPVIKIKNIESGGYVSIRSVDKVSENILTKNLLKYILSRRDIIVAMTGATAGKAGRIFNRETMLLNQRVAKIQPINGYYSFVWGRIGTENARDELYRLAGGAAQPNMSSDQIENLHLLLPEKNPILEYEKLVLPMLNKILLLQERNQNLSKIRDLLIPQLVTGKMEVKN